MKVKAGEYIQYILKKLIFNRKKQKNQLIRGS